ncbi:hypothetical protein N9M57_01445 [Opitutales bacterium]|nr:hypothetical protein [Opitutales bacterium]
MTKPIAAFVGKLSSHPIAKTCSETSIPSKKIIRVYGTDKIPESDVIARGISDDGHRIYTVNEAVAHYLTGQNFDEAFLYSLRNPEETQFFFGEESHKVLALDNPLQSDQSHLRASLLSGLLDVLKLNAARGTGGTRFFERGHVYRDVKGEMVELVSVSFVIVADQISREWCQREVADFYTAKTISGATLNKITLAENSTASFNAGSTVTSITNLANNAQLTMNNTYSSNLTMSNASSLTVNGTLNGNFGINSTAMQYVGEGGTVNGDIELNGSDQMTVAGDVNGRFSLNQTSQAFIEATANILSNSNNSWIYNTAAVTWNVGADGSVGTLKTSRNEQNAGQFDGEWRYDASAVDMVVDLTNCAVYATPLSLKLVSGIQYESAFASNVTFLLDGADVTSDFVWDGAGTGSFTGVIANPDPDADGDGVADNVDAFPNDPTETVDTDGDNVGDNADVFPNDPTETVDTDGDNVGDNGDVHPGYNDAELTTYLSNNSYIVDDGTGGGTGGGLTEQDLIDLRIGSQMASIANDQATLQVVIEQSDDLGTWSTLQTESVTVDVPAGTSKQFFRYRMQD